MTRPHYIMASDKEQSFDALLRTVAELKGTEPGISGEADIQIYKSLGAMALDLTPEQRERLETGGALVAANEHHQTGVHDQINQPIAPPATHSWCLSLMGLGPNYQGPTGKGVTVAVLDTGLDCTHPDFAGRVPPNNLQDFGGSGTAHDVQGHGTHCAGLIAGPRTSASGIRYGVAPDVDLLIGKVVNDQGRGSDDNILSGITWAARRGARIISLSLGTGRIVRKPFSPVYERIASRLRRLNILVVGASGNESFRPLFVAAVGNPGACPSILAISAVDRMKRIANFSSGGMDHPVAFAAPGVSVFSSVPVAKGSFGKKSGTSMAAPYAAGVLALYLEQNPEITADDLLASVRTDSLGPERDFGRGLMLVP